MDFTVSRWKAFLIVLLVWAGIYLFGLGHMRLRGMEGSRIVSALNMLEKGNWMVQWVGGHPYYNKPPGLNWLIALSFALTGEQSATTARLPSVIFILIFVSLLIWLPFPWLSLEGRFISALIFLTSISIIGKGRTIEIEGVYVSLTGIATLSWLYMWLRNYSKWLLWMIPSIILAFGMLVKGPFILIFFYSVVIAVLWYSGKLKELFRVEHFLGIGVVALVTAAWFYLAFQRTSASAMTSQMSSQLLIRVFVRPDFVNWGRSVATAFGNFLPWLLFVPLLWDRNLTSRIEQAHVPLFRGCRLGLVVGFAIINLMPGMFPRYSMPVIPLASILTGWVLSLQKEAGQSTLLWKKALLVCFFLSCLTAAAGVTFVEKRPIDIFVLALTICAAVVVFRQSNRIQSTSGLCVITAALIVVAVMQYSTFGLRIITSRELRAPEGMGFNAFAPAAMGVHRFVPASQTVYIFDAGAYLPDAYIRPPLKYINDPSEIDGHVHYLLLKKADFQALKASGRISSRSPEVLYEFPIPTRYALVRLN